MNPFPQYSGIEKSRWHYIFFLAVIITSCTKVDSSIQKNAASAVASEALSASKLTQPNVIIFLADDIGYEVPTCDGGRSYSTPNIDYLSANGMRFTQCYGAALCSPSRFMLLTGKYNFRNYTEWGVMSRNEKTMGNLFKDAGYATCYVGKWQLDGGDTSIHTFGFDNYNVWLPYKVEPEAAAGSKYKSPVLYVAGDYLPSSVTKNKYSVDFYTKYALDFIDSNAQKPFFLYYSMPLAHKPFTPTPDDPEFYTNAGSHSNVKYFPSMVEYMDKQIDSILEKLRSKNLESKTLFVFIGDNGTPKGIYSSYNDIVVAGDKGKTTTYGTHVPLIFYMPGKIKPSTVKGQLVDFTDFLPTISDITNIPIPQSWGIMDGTSFASVLAGYTQYTSKDYVFCHFQPLISPNNLIPIRYVQDSVYKQYEGGPFYNIQTDVLEKHPIPVNNMTQEELDRRQYFLSILSTMHN